jgi:predicted nucleic acid-binding protein
MQQITIDTNVWVHAGNPGCDQFEDASLFIEAVRESDVLICHDPGDIYPPESCSSLIVTEYWQHIGPANPIRALLVDLIVRERFVAASDHLRREHLEWLGRNIHDARDRSFVRVAANTDSRLLVTHDNRDYSTRVRRELGRKIQVLFVDAANAHRRLQPA